MRVEVQVLYSPPLNADLAQKTERRTRKAKVGGLNPSIGTIIYKEKNMAENEDKDRGILHNKLYDTAWSMILAIMFMPIIAPAREIARCVFDKDGNNYYDKNGIAYQNAIVEVANSLEETTKEVKPTVENKDEYLKVFKLKLDEEYAKKELHLDYDKYAGEYGDKEGLRKFFEAYYIKIAEILNENKKGE